VASINVAGKHIGQGYPVHICAEIGGNHNGVLETALKLIDVAVDAGCDSVKFQKREPKFAIPLEQQTTRRDTPWGNLSYLEYREKLEFGPNEFAIIDEYCKQRGIMWFASAWDIPSVGFLASRDVPVIKIASASLTDTLLLDALASTGRPLILSTGMSTTAEIDEAVSALSNTQLLLCHCNSTYPCPPEDLNLFFIQALQAKFPDIPVGYSGHEVGLPTTIAAVALGACFIERHITLDRTMWGTDQSASIEPLGLKMLVNHIRTVEVALGDGIKRVTEGEISIRDKLRKVKDGSIQEASQR